MTFLRTASTRRLLATIAGVLAVIAGGTAIAVAATGSGPVPKPASLAEAIHDGLSAPKLSGISANISFTDNLIDASNLQGSDPLLQGASGRLWVSPATHQLRLELQSDNGDAQVLVNGTSFWVSDPSSGTVYEGTLPAREHAGDGADRAPATIPSLAQIQADLNKLTRRLDVGGAVPGDTAGQPTYTVRVSPKHDNGLLGTAQLAFDAARGVPLDVAVYASGDTTPVLALQATGVSFGAVSPSVFAITPPAGDKVVKLSAPTAHASAQHADRKLLTGVASVAASLPFTLAAPSAAAGLVRHTVAGLDWGGKAGALVTYGQGIGAVAVIERPSGATATSGATGAASGRARGSGGDASELSLPTVSIDGTTAQELDTALGTMITFSREGVSYTVIGSVAPSVAKAAAIDLANAL